MSGDDDGYDELQELVAEHRAKKARRLNAASGRLPPPPAIPRSLAERTAAERERVALREASQWFAETMALYSYEGRLDAATEAKIRARANIHYRSLTGRDMPQEAFGESPSAGNDSAATGPATAGEATVAAPERPTARVSHYNRRSHQWERGHSGHVPFGAYGPETLRKRLRGSE